MAVLVVDAAAAYAGGVTFSEAGPGTWLAGAVPAAYLRVGDGYAGTS